MADPSGCGRPGQDFGLSSESLARPANKNAHLPLANERFYMAGDEGFEPPILGPEPSALPLGQSPSAALV
jgi:hypothetical protein